MVAVPFVIIMLGILELTLMFASSSLLQGATTEAARTIRTGQVQNAADPEDMFRDALCRQAATFMNCDDIQYEVIKIVEGDFLSAGDYEAEYDEDGNLVSSGFEPGEVSDVILVRTAYRYPLLTPFMSTALSDGHDGTYLLEATVVFQTEPYEFEG